LSFRSLRNARGFFSEYYLGSVFGREGGRGRRRTLSDRQTDVLYTRFQRMVRRAGSDLEELPASRERLVRPLLRDILGIHLGAGSGRVHGFWPSAEAEAAGDPPLALAYCGVADEDLDAGRGAANPTVRLGRELASAGLRWGLLVTPERLRLIRAEGDGPRGAHLEADLEALAETDDPESFAAAVRLLSVASFVPGPDGRLPLDRVEEESRRHAEKVSADLKRAVFEAAEALVDGLLTDAEARGRVSRRADLAQEQVVAYRDAALVALYRLLFILYAEARDERLGQHPVYSCSYPAPGLREELLSDPSRPWPANRHGLWERLLATFRIFDEGLPRISGHENIPARGGDFFDASTPEGRLLAETRLPDRTVARLLVDLTTTRGQPGLGRERISFRELDIEQLGAVYEGLLEHEPRVARATTLEVRVKSKMYALAAAELVRLIEEKDLTLTGAVALVAGTAAEALHPDTEAPDDDVAHDDEDDDQEEEDDGDSRDQDDDDARPSARRGGPCHLLRRLEPGDFHFVPSAARKGSGSFYTPLPLVRDLVRHSLGPLVDGRTAVEIERLRVLDPACGSGHFLVEAMRFLGRALHRAHVEALGDRPPETFRSTLGQGWDADWRASDEQARAANSEARAWCKRRIAERCLYGVDLNPTAVGLARVALWVESLAGDRPLTYFEHHVRCGNSLLGTWLDRLRHPPLPSLGEAPAEGQSDFILDAVKDRVVRAASLRRVIDEATPEALLRQGLQPESVEELDFKERQRREAEEVLADARLLFDLRSSSAFVPELWGELAGMGAAAHAFVQGELSEHLQARAEAWRRQPEERRRGQRDPWLTFEEVRRRERFFHWELEYPEVFAAEDRPGFDVVLGNPPWDKVLPTKLEFYGRFDVLIRAYSGNALDRRIAELHDERPALEGEFQDYQARAKTVASFLRQGGDFPLSEARSQAAHEDVSKYFLDRALRLARGDGAVGLVLPSVVYNGDGCVGIRRFLLSNATVARFYGFENGKEIFPIHRSYKFFNLVVFKAPNLNGGFLASFMRHDLAELESDSRKPWEVQITRDEIARLSPDTLAFLEYRGPRDQEIVHRMHEGRPTLGDDGPGSWGARFVSWRAHESVFNSSQDKDLFTNPSTGRLHTPVSVLGADPGNTGETIERMRERGFWPVFEGKHLDQWLAGTKPIRWWLSVDQAEAKYGRPPRSGATLMFRETARNTDERTCIAAVLPRSSAAAHTLTGLDPGSVDVDVAAIVLNSFAFDWALRFRVAGTHVSFTYMRPMPVPPAEVANLLPRIPTRLAWERGLTHVTDDETVWPFLWESNRAVAEAYDLGPDDLAHILTAFPGVKKKRPAFFDYLLARVDDWRPDTDS